MMIYGPLPGLLAVSLALGLAAGCRTFPSWSSTHQGEYPASIEIVEAEASLHRLGDPDPLGDDFFMLQTTCLVQVENQTGRAQEVLSFFGSAFDDLRLRLRDEQGRKLTTTTHTLWVDPLLEGRWYRLEKGTTMVELSSATLVGPEMPDEGYPMIRDRELTQIIQLEYFGGFPGSDLPRAIQSNRVTVKIADRTGEVQPEPMPLPKNHV